MRGDSKQRFIFWLIGFGCGIVLSSVIMLGIIFNTREYKEQLLNEFSNAQEQKPEQQSVTSGANVTDTVQTPSSQLEEPVNLNDNNKQESTSTSESVLTTKQPSEEKDEEKKQEEITIDIPPNSTAIKICELLEKEGVVENAEEFARYISESKKTKYLRSGKITFPMNADYEVLLERLLLSNRRS